MWLGRQEVSSGAGRSERTRVNRLLSAEWWACDTVEGARVLTWKMLQEACHGCLSADKMCLRYPCSAFSIRVIFLVVPDSEEGLLPRFAVGEYAAGYSLMRRNQVIFQYGITLLHLFKDWKGSWRWGFNSAIFPWSVGLIPNQLKSAKTHFARTGFGGGSISATSRSVNPLIQHVSSFWERYP